METKRILLNGGHTEITVAGEKYLADEDGCFTVPEAVAEDLLKRTEGKYVPGLEVLQQMMEAADAHVGHCRRQLEVAESSALKAHDDFDEYVAKSKTAAVNKHKAHQPQQQVNKK